MGRLGVQVLEGARKVINNTNTVFLASSWYVVAKFETEIFWSYFSPLHQVYISKAFQQVEVQVSIDCLCQEQHQNLLHLKHNKGPPLRFARCEYLYLERGSNTNWY